MDKLKTPFQIQVILYTQDGFDEYTAKHPRNPGYFLHFKSVDEPDALQKIYDGLTWIQNKILFASTEKKTLRFAFVKKVPGGPAGAEYIYAEPPIQQASGITSLEVNMISKVSEWCAAHNAIMNPANLSPTSDEKFMIITIQLKTNSL